MGEEEGDREGEEELNRQEGNGSLTARQQAGTAAVRLLLPVLRRRRRPRVYRFPAMPRRESRDRREQNRAVEARLGDGEMDGEEEGTEALRRKAKVYGEGLGGGEAVVSMLLCQVGGVSQAVGTCVNVQKTKYLSELIRQAKYGREFGERGRKEEIWWGEREGSNREYSCP